MAGVGRATAAGPDPGWPPGHRQRPTTVPPAGGPGRRQVPPGARGFTMSWLFERRGDRVIPTRHAVGPWPDGRLHGGAVSGLLAETVEPLVPLDHEIIAIRVELLGPVGRAALVPLARVVRSGRGLSIIDADLGVDGRVAARASATATPTSGRGPELVRPLRAPPPETGEVPPARVRASSPFFELIDFRILEGAIEQPGPAVLWARSRHRWFADEEPGALARLLAIVDTAYGYGQPTSSADWLTTNIDLTVHLLRTPDGDWIHLDTVTDIGPWGVGVGRAELGDRRGRLGVVTQSVIARPV